MKTVNYCLFSMMIVPLLFQANIHSIMASEDKVVQLMRLLDEGLSEANYIEEKLDYYDQLLQVCVHTHRYTYTNHLHKKDFN